MAIGVVGCVADAEPPMGAEDEDEAEDTGGTDDESDTLLPPGPGPGVTTTPPMETDTEGDTETDGCNFFDCAETDTTDPPPGPECSVWEQDCLDGQKCNPYADDGGPLWNSAKCIDIVSDAGTPGDPCETFGGGTSGDDTCGQGSMCWANNEDGTGVCIALCGGSENNPLCDDVNETCTIWNEGFLPLCSPSCHPVAQDCEIDQMGCYPTADGTFTCLFDASGPMGGAFAEPCGAANACDEGLLCGGAAIVPDCVATSCCTEFCDLTEDGNPCSGEGGGQECLPFFDEGEAPPDYQDVGFCGIPQ